MQAPGSRPDSPMAEADPLRGNVEMIARLEQNALGGRSQGEKVSGLITKFTGNIVFVSMQAALFVIWAVVNTGLLPGVRPFDPFPFGMLALIVSAEGVFLALFILISQNQMSRQADRRAHLALQVSILAEQELTELLRMQKRMTEHLGISDQESKKAVEKLMESTDVETLVDELGEKLPDA